MLAVDVGIAIHPDFVAEFAAEQLIQRYAVCLARQIPQRDLDARYAAALTRWTTELLDLAKAPSMSTKRISVIFSSEGFEQSVIFSRSFS